jgi:hypothetical protein
VAEAAAPAAAWPAATAGPSSSRKNGRQTQGAQKKRKGRAADEESSDEEQESMTSACSSSEEDEDDGEEDGVDADASERATSDDEDDGDAASSSSSVGAAKAPRKQTARAKKRRVEEPAPPPVSDATRMTAAEAMLAVKETALCSAMREIAAQSYEDVRAWRDGGRAPAMAEASACQVAQDLGDIQQATTPTAIVAAMSNLVKTLASAHREHFEGETCTVPTAQVKRLHAACTKATEFSQATLEEMDKAIAGLTRARELGRKALEEVASPGPSSA